MSDATIENPILNSPFLEPTRHFKFGDHGITNESVNSRRVSTYFMPIPKPKKKGRGKQLALDDEWVEERVAENVFINPILTRGSRSWLRRWKKNYRKSCDM